MGAIENYERERKIAEVEQNYNAKKDTMTVGTKTYRITEESILDIVGLVALNQGSNIGVMENGQLALVYHSPNELKQLLESIRVYLTGIKTTRFTKILQLKSLTTQQEIVNFDTSV